MWEKEGEVGKIGRLNGWEWKEQGREGGYSEGEEKEDIGKVWGRVDGKGEGREWERVVGKGGEVEIEKRFFPCSFNSDLVLYRQIYKTKYKQ